MVIAETKVREPRKGLRLLHTFKYQARGETRRRRYYGGDSGDVLVMTEALRPMPSRLPPDQQHRSWMLIGTVMINASIPKGQ